MEIADLLTVDQVALNLRARDKRGLIAALGKLAADRAPGVAAGTIERALAQREQLGSTGLGSGFALPHAKVAGLATFLAMFVRLVKPIDFAAIDGKPVDTVFLLLIPEDAVDHVAALAAVSRRFRDPNLRVRLLAAATPGEVFDILTKR
jgi:nitrogen PTS system EIIA component